MFRNRLRSMAMIAMASSVLLLSASCTKNKADSLPLAEAGGIVTLDGKPLTSGTVTFVPDVRKGTTGPTGVGKIGNDGKYQIRTAGRDGALVGYHKIRVNSTDSSKPGAPWVIPIRYDHPDHSGLSGRVKAGEPNDIPLRLKSKV